MNGVAELVKVQNPRKNLKSDDFSYERLTTCRESVSATSRMPRGSDGPRQISLIRLLTACHQLCGLTSRPTLNRNPRPTARQTATATRAMARFDTPANVEIVLWSPIQSATTYRPIAMMATPVG